MKTIKKTGSESTIKNNSQTNKTFNNNLNSKQMKKTETNKDSGFPKVSTLMDEEKYWLIIGTIFNSSEEDPEWKYKEQLSKLPSKEVIQFYLRTSDLTNRLYRASIGTAAEIINNFYNLKYDFDFYVLFRFWIITLGERIYYKVLEDPDYLVNIVKVDEDLFYINEYLGLIPKELFLSKMHKEIFEFIDSGNVSDKEETFNSEDYKTEKNKRKTCPKLYDAFYQTNTIRELKNELLLTKLTNNHTITTDIDNRQELFERKSNSYWEVWEATFTVMKYEVMHFFRHEFGFCMEGQVGLTLGGMTPFDFIDEEVSEEEIEAYMDENYDEIKEELINYVRENL